ncbi:thioredoxin [Acidovorax sp. Root275]|uniref:DsbA family protein n=1 Tax=Acidovorax sp. Root275 TaxID=1736508 RepID=UPI00070A15D4|nr:DsbA family protein [Acidovorax sp. Root275]KRD46678.1 thioredoxin [Acidovorax sp. Root275]
MNSLNLNKPTVVYVFDAYCGWCWGFSNRVSEFEAANRDRVAFAAVSGGLLTGKRVSPISFLTHIPEANARITRLTGAEFGEEFKKLLEEGSFEMNSSHAGAAMAALKLQAPDRAVDWAHQLLEAFFQHGLSLSEPSTVAAIALRNGLDELKVLRALADGSAQSQAEADFALARELGVNSYPTLLYVDGTRVHQLPGTGTSLAELNSTLDSLLA